MIELTEIYAIYKIICIGEFRTAKRTLNPQRLLKKRRPDIIGAMVLRMGLSVPQSIGVPQL